MNNTARLNAAEKNALAFNSARVIVRTVSVSGSDDAVLFTLDHDGASFVATQHGFKGSIVVARPVTKAELFAFRATLPGPNDEGEGLGNSVAVTDRADRAMRA